jgi:hypothetical protein
MGQTNATNLMCALLISPGSKTQQAVSNRLPVFG